ncbi:hypothetical protein [Acidisphaera sp. L21]|uniref:hypothetical protein n=1 Tax=Acidisphaera sp. L21 TaxID=1641851 RepID=UPI00131BF317|nr:hypothetical protein [Acidisphaera sp. L21]
MDNSNSMSMDDDSIAAAAQQLILRYRREQSTSQEAREIPASSAQPNLPPDDPRSLRLAIDNMAVAIEEIQRQQVSREAVLIGAMERIERNVAKLAGRIDALMQDMVQLQSQPIIDIDAIVDQQRVAANSMLQEFGRMMEMGRSLLDETIQIHSQDMKTPGDPDEKTFTP